jgi:hypothetical protein
VAGSSGALGRVLGLLCLQQRKAHAAASSDNRRCLGTFGGGGGGGGARPPRGLTIAVRRPALQLCGKCHFTHQDVTATAIPAAAAAAVFTPSVALSLHAPSREACGAQHAVNYSSTATE